MTTLPLRSVPRLNKSLTEVGLGCWQLGSDWGEVSESTALELLGAAYAAGIRFFDTADVYGTGRSEQLIGKFRAANDVPDLTVATKMGRLANPHTPEAYNLENFRTWTDSSRRNLGVDTLDLIQLHCPPPAVYGDDRAFDALDTLVDDGAIKAYGVSVETTEEALRAIARPGVATIQIIVNIFRQKPLAEVLPAAAAAGVGIIARVPLASGLLSGRYDVNTTFADGDHRTYNRKGEAFDVGETFAGVPFEIGVDAAQQVQALFRQHFANDAELAKATTAQWALRWILDQPGISTVIPGARNVEQANGNAGAAALPSLPADLADELEKIYQEQIAPHVHHRW